VRIRSWTEVKDNPQENYAVCKSKGAHRKIIAALTQGLKQNDLSCMRVAAYDLHQNPDAAARVVRHFKAKLAYRLLSFRWFPDNRSQCGKFLIRDQSIGLVIKSAPGFILEGIKMTPGDRASFCSIAPKDALSHLSKQVSPQRRSGIDHGSALANFAPGIVKLKERSRTDHC
jgi:hypothetical protein